MSRSVFTLHPLALFHLFFYLCPVLVSRFFGDLFRAPPFHLQPSVLTACVKPNLRQNS